MKKILIIDDEPEMLESLSKILSYKKDFEIATISDSTEANKLIQKEQFDIIITDLKMKPISGIEILRTTMEYHPESIVIMISGYGTIEASVEAMKEGAFDFIEKPFTSKTLFECIDRALERVSKETTIKNEDENFSKISNFIYKSKKMDEIIDIVKKVATGSLNILITGESGTGKELIARAVHNLSKRNHNPFVPVNCGALPENLFESELFGHERGAFTGAVKTKPGLLEFANHGTFFFDEIGDMSQGLQVKLLRMLEERKIRRVGGQNEIAIDVRIIAATNKDLEQLVSEKIFREDLYYRLNTIQVEIPPLRERKDDILPLAKHFLTNLCAVDDKQQKRFSPEAEEILKNYPWPGNVRELQNIINRTYILSSSVIIQKNDLPITVEPGNRNRINEFLSDSYKNAKDKIIEKFEMEYLTHHLKLNQGNITQTAEKCGLDRRSIHRLINKYSIIYQEDGNK
ncbi:MAG TPA: sigma-54 dependent transcriptional regulator [Ignavibacteriaceae bacterium]|nr:sigma-54 dependent transcriptional regulator [Ignavibacteriaceae bacterium]